MATLRRWIRRAITPLMPRAKLRPRPPSAHARARTATTPAFPFERYRRLRFGDSGRPSSCPHCGGRRLHRWGSFSGRRRYRCIACGRTFSDFTGTPLATLKRVDRWPAFCDCALESLSLRRTGRLVGIDKDTAFRWRHRILAALHALDTADGAGMGPTVAFLDTWFPHSRKGSRSLRRPARRRAAYHRLHVTPVWVFVARDSGGRAASGVVGSRRPTTADLAAALGDRLDSASALMSGSGPHGAVGMLADRLHLDYRRATLHTAEDRAVRDYTVALRRWLRRFRGVATRYLHHYLAWHRFLTAGQPASDRAPHDAGAPPPRDPEPTDPPPHPGRDAVLAGRFP